MESESVDLEHISYWLTKYEGKYAKSPCSCRRSRLYHDEGCADDPEGWCVAVGDMADYVVETQKDGCYITNRNPSVLHEGLQILFLVCGIHQGLCQAFIRRRQGGCLFHPRPECVQNRPHRLLTLLFFLFIWQVPDPVLCPEQQVNICPALRPFRTRQFFSTAVQGDAFYIIAPDV